MADRFTQTQRAFLGSIRDPENFPTPPDIEERRMAVYRELIYNNVEDFLANTYPVLKEILGEESWHTLVRDYFREHRASTPLFMQMPREFLVYLQKEREPETNDYPFMLELAHYEWTELELAVSEEKISMQGVDSNGDLLEARVAISPLCRILGYQYPVHKIGVTHLPTEPESTFLIIFRDRKDNVEFIELNQVTALLLNRIQNDEQPTREILVDIARELNHPDPDRIIEFGIALLEDLHKRGVILGTYL
ncbi:MAG: HvfC family RiPP maturation protein [Acidiferrobacterales bacterium]